MSYQDMQPASERQQHYIQHLGRTVLGLSPEELARRLHGITGGRITNDPPLRRHDAARVIARFKQEAGAKGGVG